MNIDLIYPLDQTTDLQEKTKTRRIIWRIQEDIAKLRLQDTYRKKNPVSSTINYKDKESFRGGNL